MRARLERGVDGCAARRIAGLPERERFGVMDAVVSVEAFAEDCVVLDDDGADHRARAGERRATSGEVDRAADVVDVMHVGRTVVQNRDQNIGGAMLPSSAEEGRPKAGVVLARKSYSSDQHHPVCA